MQQRGSNYVGTTISLAAMLLGLGLSACGGGGTTGLADNSPDNLGGIPADLNISGGNSAQSFFDKTGGTSSFGIPAGVTGTVSAGEQVFNANCAGCHGSGLPALSFTELQAKMARPPMSSITLTQQELADLTAWLNRNATPPPAAPPPAAGGPGTGNPGTGGTGTGPGADDDSDDAIGGDDDSGDDSSIGGDDDSDDSGSGDDSSIGGDDDSDDSGSDDDSSTGGDDSDDDSSTGGDDTAGDDSGGDSNDDSNDDSSDD